MPDQPTAEQSRTCLRCRQALPLHRFPYVTHFVKTPHGAVSVTFPRGRSINICNPCHEKIQHN